ncbi:MAG: TolC family protein [Sphingobacteriales bacterium]|nr:TolC family protein [Sphingobacteriales bacterium]
MKKLFYFTAFIVLLSNAFGQDIKKISLQEAFDLAAQNSKQLMVDSLKIQALDFKKKQAQNAMLPVVGVSTSYTRLSGNIDELPPINFMGKDIVLNKQILNQYNNRVSVQQPIFQGLKNWNTMKSIGQLKIATDLDRQKDQQDIKLNVIQTYYNLYKLQQTKIVLDSNIAQTQVRVNDISKFKNAGLALNNDVMRAELQKTNLLVSQADVESAIDITNFNMCILLGLDISTKIQVENPEVVKDANTTIQSLIASSYADRAEFKAQDYRTKAADYQVKASKSAYMPTVSAVGNGYYNNPNQRIFPQENNFKSTWDVGVSVSWNIMQLYTARAIVSDAKNQKAQLLQATAQIKDGISMEVNAAYETLKVALLKIDLAQRAIDQATENKRILDNRFGAQVALLSDVLEADQFLLQAQTNLLNAQADAAIANYKLQRSLGAIK